MAKLTIGNQTVTVDDAFLTMTPDQQAATVEEIAASLGGGATPKPDTFLSRASEMSKFGAGRDTAAPAMPTPAGPDVMGSIAATMGGLVNGIPVVGPAVQNTADAIVGTGLQLAGQGSMQDYRAGAQARRAELARANPIADIAGQVGGSIAGVGGLAAIPGGASALGLTGSLGSRVLAGGLSSAGLEAADAAARGRDVAESGIIGGALGASIPVIGAGVGAIGRAIGNRVGPTIQAALDPTQEASRRLGTAVGRDRSANPAMVLSQGDESIAQAAGIPLTNADRGGEVTRALARSVANQSPEARAVITRVADDRFTSQAPRAVEFIKRLTGGAVDDIGYQRTIQDTARAVNRPRYDAAFNAPAARAVWNKPIQELMQSNTFRSAINAAESRGTDKAAISGFRAVRNPFEFMQDGSVTLRQNADGSRALPSLAFWDQVKRNIDGLIGTAQRSGDNALYADLTQIKQKLVSSLDQAVPQYQSARQGAASFFDAEDALDAGKKFANQPRAIPEAQAAFAKFSGPEKAAFQTGYASEIIDKIKAGGDRRNIIQQYFGSPASREQAELVFGPAKARQLEAYVRVEGLADQLRGSLGNSTTARQLVELGIGGGAGFALSGDWQGALTGAALAKGGRWAGEKVDARVMEELAKLLASGTRSDLDKAVFQASISPKWLQAMESLQMSLSAPARGAALAVSGGAGLQE